LNLPKQSQEYFVNCKALGGARAARTGDLGVWSEDGELQLVGRLGSMVKVRGARIDLGEVEVAIAAHQAVKACVVVVHDDMLVAYVQPGIPTDLREFCKGRLVAYMVPQRFQGLEELPRLANGKVNKKALKPPSASQDEIETVMELDSLGQMRKFSRLDAAEDVVLDNVRAVLLGVVIMSHMSPLEVGNSHMLNKDYERLDGDWASWQYWFLYLLRSGGWSSLAFLSGFDDTRAEHKGYALTYREALFVVLWVAFVGHPALWYLPAFVVMRMSFVAFKKVGLEYTQLLLVALLFIFIPAFVDLYIGAGDGPDSRRACTCFCPFEGRTWLRPLSYVLVGFYNKTSSDSFLGHRLVFVPCYLIGLYCGKYVFPVLCGLSKERNKLWRLLIALSTVAMYLVMFAGGDAVKDAYDDRCSSFWNGGHFLWLQVLKNIRYFVLNLSMSFLYVIVITALVPIHLKYLAKNSFLALLFSPMAGCVLDFPAQALALRQQLPALISPAVEMAWLMAVPVLYEYVSGAVLSAFFRCALQSLSRNPAVRDFSVKAASLFSR